MAYFDPKAEGAIDLAGSVWVLTGGANGIGEQIVRSVHSAGGFVVFGDVAEEAGEKLASELGHARATFLKTNVLNYADQLALFQTALKKHEKVDHVIPVAGIAPKDTWYLPSHSIEDVEKEVDDKVLDINLRSVLNFTRIALPYLRHNAQPSQNKSITLVSSVAGFLDSPHIPIYSVTKHGVMGLMHALRKSETMREGMRVNCINPSFVSTAMTQSFAKTWTSSGMPVNTPQYIAEVVLGLASQKSANGMALYISGNKSWDIEEGLARTAKDWMGEAMAGMGTQGSRDEWTRKVSRAGDMLDLDEKERV